MDQVYQALFTLVASVITVLAAVATANLKKYLAKKGLLADTETKQKSARIIVEAVEQLATVNEIPDKFEEAKKRLVNTLNAEGIQLSDEALEDLIESAVIGLKEGWNKQ